jgi:hypothetical protein
MGELDSKWMLLYENYKSCMLNLVSVEHTILIN